MCELLKQNLEIKVTTTSETTKILRIKNVIFQSFYIKKTVKRIFPNKLCIPQ